MDTAPHGQPTDEQLVERVQRGQPEAFAGVFQRHHRRIARFLRQAGVPEAEVEDLVGEPFCRALQRIESFDVGRGKRTLSYLYAIARNLAADRGRGRASGRVDEWTSG